MARKTEPAKPTFSAGDPVSGKNYRGVVVEGEVVAVGPDTVSLRPFDRPGMTLSIPRANVSPLTSTD